jgi:hypothetical protein
MTYPKKLLIVEEEEGECINLNTEGNVSRNSFYFDKI